MLSDVPFNISTKKDMSEIIKTVKTNDKGLATFNELELGTYYIQEAKQIDGYVLNNHIYKVEITKDGDILEINCVNTPTEMQFSKQDITTGKELPGASITVTDKETGKVIDEWISTGKPHIIKYLVEGRKYIMTEKIAPKGYEFAKSITFTAKHGEKIVMKDKLKPTIPQTGDNTNLTLWLALVGISSIGVLGSIYLARRKKEGTNE